MLAKYNINLEAYIDSFNNTQLAIQNSKNNLVKCVLDRKDIKLKSYLFSTKFVELINNDIFYSQRFTVNDEAICFNREDMLPTTSNSRQLNSILLLTPIN